MTDALDARLSELLDQALIELSPLGLGAELADEPIRSIRFELADSQALVTTDGIVYGSRPLTAVLFVVAALDAAAIDPRERLSENATAAVGWYADRLGRWGLRDGIPGDPLDGDNLRARVSEAARLLSRPLQPRVIVGGEPLANVRAMLERTGVEVSALDDALAFTTPGGPVELRLVRAGSGLATVVWVEVGRSQRPDLHEWLLSGVPGLREGAAALAPDGRVIVRGWMAGEPLEFARLTRLLAPLLTTATQLRDAL
jgi:hypothetical protein